MTAAIVHRPGAVVRIGPVSAVVRWRQVLVPAVGAVVLVLLSAVSLGRGDFPIGLADVLRAMAGVGDPGQQFVVRELRAPRIVVGLLVGAALGVAGALFQTVGPQRARLARRAGHQPGRLGRGGGGDRARRRRRWASRWPRWPARCSPAPSCSG